MSTGVVILTTYFRPVVGGVESTAERLARFLQTAGFDVRVVTKRIGADLPDRERLDGNEISRIGPRGQRSAAGKWLFAPAAFRWLIGHASEYRVVCVIDYRGIGISAVAARTLTRRPVIFHGQTPGLLAADSSVGAEGFGAHALRSPLRAVYRRADAIACISHALEREALASGVSPDRVHFIPNAIDAARFTPPTPDERARLRAARGWAPDRPVCLFVGRLSREKGLLDLLNAWKRLQPSAALLAIAGPDMAGSPWDVGPAAREFVAREGLEGSVEFLGPIGDVPAVLGAADVVAQPSHFEAQGLSAVEALASGVPVVASAVGGLVDFIADGRNGRLVPARDPQALADALAPLLANAGLRAELARQARASVVPEYDERHAFGRFAALIRQLAGEQR